jgi:hypothetical protein
LGIQSFIIEEVADIAAPVQVVWQVITDLPAYGEWNRFVVSCRSSLVGRQPIDMRVVLFGSLAQPQSEVVFENSPGERLCYGLHGDALGALRSRRCHHLQAIAPERTSYRSHFELSGWLSPVVRGLLGRRLERGFHLMTSGIQHRAEELSRAG